MDRLWSPWRMKYIQGHTPMDECPFCAALEADDPGEHNLVHRAAFRIQNVDAAGHAGIEGVDGAQDFDRVFQVGDGRAYERRFVGAGLPGRITRGAVPGAGNDRLVILDLLVLDVDPVAQGAARRFGEAPACGLTRPIIRVPGAATPC